MTRIFLLAVLAFQFVPDAGQARSLDAYLKGVEFCEQSNGLRALRKKMNALVPGSHSSGSHKYEVGPTLMAQIRASVPATVSRDDPRN